MSILKYLNYVRLILKYNTTNYKNTQSLTYIWQIEWATKTIKDFYVNYDWEITVLNESWIYKLTFEISDDKVIIR